VCWIVCLNIRLSVYWNLHLRLREHVRGGGLTIGFETMIDWSSKTWITTGRYVACRLWQSQAKDIQILSTVVWITGIATRCNTQQHTATHVDTQQHIATHCNALPRTAIYCNTLFIHTCNTLQHTVTHCNTLCNTLRCKLLSRQRGVALQTATHCSTL